MSYTDPGYIELQFISDDTSPVSLPSGGSPYTGIGVPVPPDSLNHSEVFGISIIQTIPLGTVIDTSEAPPGQGPGSGPDWIEPPGGWPPAQWVYGLSINGVTPPVGTTINLGAVGTYLDAQRDFTGVFGPGLYQRRPTTYFRIQADGGGRQVMYAAYGDDSPRRFFELWKDGIRFSFLGLPDPVVQLRSPTGVVTQRPVTMHDSRAYGRFGVDLGELAEIGDWKMQVRFVEESDSLGAFSGRENEGGRGPQAPEPPQELWRALHKPLILRVCAGAEGIW